MASTDLDGTTQSLIDQQVVLAPALGKEGMGRKLSDLVSEKRSLS